MSYKQSENRPECPESKSFWSWLAVTAYPAFANFTPVGAGSLSAGRQPMTHGLNRIELKRRECAESSKTEADRLACESA